MARSDQPPHCRAIVNRRSKIADELVPESAIEKALHFSRKLDLEIDLESARSFDSQTVRASAWKMAR
jgi:hypothetical protein